MVSVKMSAVASALLAVSATSFAMEPDQRAMELAESLAKAAPIATTTAKSSAQVSTQAAAALRAQGQAAGLSTDTGKTQETK